MSFNIEVEGGKTVKLPTAGKYCDRDILVTTTGGGYTEDDLQAKYDDGVQAEHSRFWDAYQQNGDRTDYQGCFAGKGWTDETFKPKYNINPTGNAAAYYLFRRSGISDLKSCLDAQGVEMDLSGCTGNHTEVFSYSTELTRVPTIDLSAAGNIVHLFSYCEKLETVDKLVVQESSTYTYPFYQCYALKNIVVEGTIGSNGCSFQHSTALSKDSIISVINALSTTKTGLTVTFSKTSVNKAFETAAGAADGSTSAEWTALKNSTNWTITLL